MFHAAEAKVIRLFNMVRLCRTKKEKRRQRPLKGWVLIEISDENCYRGANAGEHASDLGEPALIAQVIGKLSYNLTMPVDMYV